MSPQEGNAEDVSGKLIGVETVLTATSSQRLRERAIRRQPALAPRRVPN